MNNYFENKEDFKKKLLKNLNYEPNISQYAIFQISDKLFAISINYIKEFIEYRKITSLPDSFEFIAGVINYRGETIPVVDLKKKISETSKNDYGKYSVIIIINFNNKLYGILSDNIIDIANFEENKFNKDINLITKVEKKIIKAVYNFNKEIILVLNIEKLLDFKEQKY